MAIAQACVARNLRVAEVSLGAQEESCSVPQVGEVLVVDASSKSGLQKFEDKIKMLKTEGFTPVAIDADPKTSYAEVLNKIGLPFVSSWMGEEVQNRTKSFRNSAIVGPFMSRDMLMLDDMLDAFSRRHRGFFNDHTLSVLDDATSTSLLFDRAGFHRTMFDSFERLMDQELDPEVVIKKDDKVVTGRATTTYALKGNATGTSSLEFKVSIGDQPVSEAVVDSAIMLANKVANMRGPRVWPIGTLLEWQGSKEHQRFVDQEEDVSRGQQPVQGQQQQSGLGQPKVQWQQTVQGQPMTQGVIQGQPMTQGVIQGQPMTQGVIQGQPMTQGQEAPNLKF
jgi:hypothetical protein